MTVIREGKWQKNTMRREELKKEVKGSMKKELLRVLRKQ